MKFVGKIAIDSFAKKKKKNTNVNTREMHIPGLY